ncbi:MAG: S9 family peptidase [bacterium JZ-2024 1]
MKKRFIQAEDLLQFRFVGCPQISPDGEKVIVPVKVIDAPKNRYLSHLWMIDVKPRETRQFTFGEVIDSSPVWSPDGKYVAFLRTDLKEKRTQIWVIHASGGEARPLTHLEEGSIGELSWAPDGKRLVCSFRRTHPEWTTEAKKKREQEGKSNPARIILRIHFREEGTGFLDLYRHIYLVDALTGEAKKITDGNYEDFSPVFSTDGKWIFFLSNRSEDPENKPYEVDIWQVSLEGKKLKKIPTPTGYKVNISCSPDGKWLAYTGVETREDPWIPRNARIYAVELKSGKVHCVSEKLDRYVGNVTLTDMREAFAGGENLAWSRKGDCIYALVSDRGKCNLYAFPMKGNPYPVTDEKWDIYGFSSDKSNRRFAFAVSDATHPGEVFLLQNGKKGYTYRPLTQFSEKWLQEVKLAEPEEVEWEGADQRKIQGWILKPPDFNPKRKYPVVYYIHGGPHAQYGWTFFHEFQVHSARGYIVFYGNPRGSMGLDEAFAAQIRGNWGDVDYQDILAGLDFLITFPFVDASHIAVAGGSYGGYMTNWIVGHTHRFCCAISERSVVNLHSFAGTSDYPFMPDGYFFGNSWSRPEELWKHSPLKYAENVQTPLLLIHSEGDLRCPISQAEEWYTALKRLKKDVLFLRYPQETNHGLSRSGPPDLRIDRLKHITHWLDRYCKPQESKKKSSGSPFPGAGKFKGSSYLHFPN